MAMELHVLSHQRLNSIAEWQKAVDAEQFALRLSVAVPFNALSGFLPAQLESNDTGFECYHDDPAEVIGDGGKDLGKPWRYALSFRFVGSFAEMRSAWMAASTYAHATHGIVYDPEEDRLYTASEALQVVRQIERDWPAMNQAMREAAGELKARS